MAAVSNNNIQFVNHEQTFVIKPPIYIVNIWPKTMLTRTNSRDVHKIQIEAVGFLPDTLCYFLPTTPLKGALYETPNADLIVTPQFINATHITCQVPADLTDIGEVKIDVHLGNSLNPDTIQQSGFQIRILDHCPNGYYCNDLRIQPCPVGYYCPGGSFQQDLRQCQVGYYQPKTRSQRCYPCLRGHYCAQEKMINPTPCPDAKICDIHKLSSPRDACPKGMYCIEGTQGDEPWYNGYFVNQTYHCAVGTYCRGGHKSGAEVAPLNYEAVPTACLRGLICHQGSYQVDGNGDCPSGYFCPHRNHTGIICPPRFYCPGRGNTQPVKCPKGTFNMHFGQKNCTDCTLGRICPTDGMFLPTLCPAGMVCNDEKLVTPQHICSTGHICLGENMSGLGMDDRSCKVLEVVDGRSKCKSFTYVIKNDTDLISNDLPLYFFKKALCCKTGKEISEWVIGIGEAINDVSSFSQYSEQMLNIYYDYYTPELEVINTPLWDGYKIIEQHLKGRGISKADGINLIDKRHELLFRILIQKMYTTYHQQVCPGGFLCMQAVYTYTPDTYLISTPFPCPSGSFCLPGSQSVIGTGLCPVGYYCPPESVEPIPTPPGTFSGNQGSVEPSLCSPGSFQLEYKSASCDSCPSGYQCKERGTKMPQICMAGYYRSVIESNICSQCPKGTFSFERGAKDYLDCQGCPPGRICETEGITNITQTAPCTDGRVCASGTGALQPQECPEGYYCPEQTSLETMYDNPCVEGFFCRLGTGGTTKTRDNCPQTYYCPPGTGSYQYVTNYTSYENWQDDAPTRCPRGTGQDGADTKTSLLQCTINLNYKLTIAAIDTRDNYNLIKKEVEEEVKPTESTNTTNSTNSTAPSPYRRLQTIEVASKDDPMLKDLWEISFEIFRSYDLRNEQNKIRQYLNLNRQYIMRINPLNLSLCDRWFFNETLDNDTQRNSEPSLIFKLIPNSYALITMDLRHLMEQEFNWVYGEDWDISITIQKSLNITEQAQPVLMPETFLHKSTTKSQMLEFQVFAWATIYMRIDVIIFNTLYINHKLAFVNSTSVEIRSPNRAIYGTQAIFIATLQEDFMIMLPFNQPPLQADKKTLPEYLVTFSQYKENNFTQVKHASTKNRNVWIPSSLYWNLRKTINIPYLPYFSNCNGYGQYIPLWSVYEQNSRCQQYELDEINYMNEFSFGQSPTADNCDQTIINCILDENPSDQQPLSRWFEVDGGTPIFNIVVDPVDYEDQMTNEYQGFDILEVAPENGNQGDGWMPTDVQFSISYFQKGLKVKKIIIVSMDFTPDAVVQLSDDQYNGIEPINYNLTFSFIPLSHKDLLVMFAFQSYLYMVLYVVIGILSIANMVILAAFHRIMARPHQGQIAVFRFFSFLQLTVPPALGGVVLALCPIMLGQMLIIIIMTGKFLTYDLRIFSCESPMAAECQYTIFDLIKDDPDNISVDWLQLRTGRCGVALLSSGAYQLYVGLGILIPDVSNKIKVAESFNGNIWNFYGWKRSNLIFCSLWVILFCVIIIQFSFSSFFGDNIWTMVISIKIIGIIIDWLLERALEDSLLVMPLSITQGTILGLVTFGSEDFLAFIDAYFIEFGIMLFERCYQGCITDIFFDYIENKLPGVINSFLTWINNDNQEEGEVDMAKNLFGNENKNKDSETSDSRVMLSDENSLLDDIKAGSDDERNQHLIFRVHADWNESASNSELSAKFRKPVKKNFSIHGMTTTVKSSLGISYDSETISLSSGQLESSGSGEQEEDDTLEDSINEQEVEPLIDCYAGFASEHVSLFYTPYFILILWVFYDETRVAKMYGIKSYDFVYYFLFALTIVPFQIVVDVIQYNLTEWFLHLPIHDYLDYLKFRFLERKTAWKGDEGTTNELLDKKLQPLDQLCFSSQFFFVQTIYVSGMCSVILGIQTLLFADGYNMFGDFGSFPVIAFIMIKSKIIHMLALQVGQCLGIWRIDSALTGKQQVVTNSDDDLFILLDQINAFQKEEQRKIEEDVPEHLKFKLKAWNQIDRIKIKDAQLKADLKTDRMMAENFKELFLQYNKPWLKENIQEVLTPRTIFAKRGEIINQLRQILGPIDANVTLSDSQKSKKSDSQKSSLSESELLRKKTNARKERLRKKFGEGGEKLKAMLKENKLSLTTRMIYLYWITRMRMIRKLKVYVKSIVDSHVDRQCLFCDKSYGLIVEVIQNIEDMFFKFLSKNSMTVNSYNFPLWIKYFRENAKYRTVCQECLIRIQYFHKLRVKKQKLKEVIGAGHDDELELILMQTKEKEKFAKKIKKISARAKQIIRSWKQAGQKSYEVRMQYEILKQQQQTESQTPSDSQQIVIQAGNESPERSHEDDDDIDISQLLNQWQI